MVENVEFSVFFFLSQKEIVGFCFLEMKLYFILAIFCLALSHILVSSSTDSSVAEPTAAV